MKNQTEGKIVMSIEKERNKREGEKRKKVKEFVKFVNGVQETWGRERAAVSSP